MFTSIVLKFDNEPKSFSFFIDNILTVCDISLVTSVALTLMKVIPEVRCVHW
jgi:hypothetical protein